MPRAAGWLITALVCFGCGDPPALEVVVRGHTEIRPAAEGSVLPVFLGGDSERTVGLCLRAEAGQVLRGRLKIAGSWAASSLEPPSTLVARTQCFEAPLALLPARERPSEICGEVLDLASGERRPLSCRQVLRPADTTYYRRAYAPWEDLRSGPGAQPFELWAARLDEARKLAEREGAWGLAVWQMLSAVSHATVSGRFAEAKRRLEALPSWLEQPAAGSWAGAREREEARLARQDGADLERAWGLLETARRRHEAEAAAGALLDVARQQAQILIRLGALEEAEARLKEAMADCAGAACPAHAARSARDQLAWLRLQLPEASAEALAAAERDLTAGLSRNGDELEAANLELNLVYAELRQAKDPSRRLGEVRRRLEALAPTERRRFLLAWVSLMEGLGALGSGDSTRALGQCRALLTAAAPPEAAPLPEVEAWAAACAGRAARRLGRGEEARRHFESALRIHEAIPAASLGQQLSLGQSERADHFFEAARLEVELGRPAAAWALLDRLDHLAFSESGRPCAGEEGSEPWLESRRLALHGELEALSSPAGQAERERRASRLKTVKEELQELARRLPCNQPAALPADLPSSGWRAFAASDEVLVLRRTPSGETSLLKRSLFPRRELKAKLEEVARALDDHRLPDEGWRRLVAPLAAALLPGEEQVWGEETSVGLYGLLQGLPLAALPLPSGDWVADRTLVVTQVRPQGVGAQAREPSKPSDSPPGRRVFVVDPTRNLAGGGELASLYRQLFPEALVLEGAAARRAALSGLADLELLHLDTHGSYDSRFPELSSLELADGPLHGAELPAAVLPRRLVNLSGCGTGRWPATADSGRWGLAGWFLRRGVPWGMASSADLAAPVALRFNREFYRLIRQGATLTEAYRQGHAAVRREFPASAWGGLLLLRNFFPARGQSGAELTPQDS